MAGRVRIVASDTLCRLHGGVHELALELFLEVGMTVETQLPFGSRLQPELVLGVDDRNGEDGQPHESQKDQTNS